MPHEDNCQVKPIYVSSSGVTLSFINLPEKPDGFHFDCDLLCLHCNNRSNRQIPLISIFYLFTYLHCNYILYVFDSHICTQLLYFSFLIFIIYLYCSTYIMSLLHNLHFTYSIISVFPHISLCLYIRATVTSLFPSGDHYIISDSDVDWVCAYKFQVATV